MDSLRRNLAEAVAAKLRTQLAEKSETEFLPGVRVLSKHFGVSVPIICQTLHILGNEGVLERGGDRKRWRLVKGKPDSGGEPSPARARNVIEPRSKKVIFLAAVPLGQESHSSVRIFASLLDRLADSGWDLVYRVEPFMDAKKPRRSWDELLDSTKPDAMIIYGGTPVIADWAAGKSFRCLFLGGNCGTSGLPMIAMKTSRMMTDAVTRLFASGHRRILFPLCGRLPAFVDRCREAALALNSRSAGDDAKVTVAESGYSGPEVIRDLLRRQWAVSPPDALILLDWQEFIAAIGFFNEAGIRIPRDLSVVMLSENTSMDWHLPTITHYHIPTNHFSKRITKWILEPDVMKSQHATLEIKATWVERQSVILRNRTKSE